MKYTLISHPSITPRLLDTSWQTLPDGLDELFIKRIPLWKRSIDIAGSLFALILLAPVLLAISALIKVVSPGPILFKQLRVGRGGSLFTCYKFRTMTLDADPTVHKEYLEHLIDSSHSNERPGDPMQKLDRDPRIIRCGNFLRSSGLDELPQLINVLFGQMSLVGPRPPIPYEVERYPNWYMARFDVVPGLTGLWQVSGKNRLGFNEMMRLDIQYASNLSLFLDFKILLMTPLVVFMQVREMRRNRIPVPKTETEMGGKQ